VFLQTRTLASPGPGERGSQEENMLNIKKWYNEKGIEMIEIYKVFNTLEDLADSVKFLKGKEFDMSDVEGGVRVKVSCPLPGEEEIKSLRLQGWVLPEKEPVPEGYVEVKIGSTYRGNHWEYGECDEYEPYYCHPVDASEINTIPLVHYHHSFNKDKAKKFYFFCLEHNVLDGEYNSPTNTEKFSIVGVQEENLPELLREWLEEYNKARMI